MPINNAPASGIKAGTVAHFAASSAPDGWIKANGAAVSRSAYGQLFTAIGTTYGAGDGSTTFNVPDLRGEFVRGMDDGRGVDSGRSIGSSQGHAYQTHNHGIVVKTGYYNDNAGTYAPTGTYPSRNTMGTWTSDNAGGGNETRPRNVAMLACIKY